MQSRRARKRGDARLDQAMAGFVDNSTLDVSKRHSMAITLNIHTKSHTVRGRPTLTLVERRYVKVRRVTKNVCRLHTKKVILNKVAKHDYIEVESKSVFINVFL